MSGAESRPEWYRNWFGEEYLALYPHRDAREADRGVELVLRDCGVPPGPVLDLACGAGRHLRELERRGLTAVGLDLSAPLLEEARAAGRSLRLVRGDMRELPFTTAGFDLVVNFFTSFGYFSEAGEDARVLAEIRRVLKPGGGFALDFLNAERVLSELVPRDERWVDGQRVVQTRRLEDGGRVVAKTIEIFDPGAERPLHVFQERVRMYRPDELRSMLRDAGFQTERIYGDYSGSELRPDSPRCILLGTAR